MDGEKKTRYRAPNFTVDETLHLRKIINKYKNSIDIKKTDGVSLREKHRAWVKVVEEYNVSTPTYCRTLESLQQCYKNIKKKAKQKVLASKMGIPAGGPQVQSQEDPILVEVSNTEDSSVGMFTIYDGDSEMVASQDEDPVESVTNTEKSEAEISPISQNTPDFKRKLNQRLRILRNRKPTTKEALSDKFQMLAEEKLELVKMQKQLVEMQMQVEDEKLAHAKKETELLEIKIKHEQEKRYHNQMIQSLELEEFKKRIYASTESE